VQSYSSIPTPLAIAAGGQHGLVALKADGTVTAWGANGSRQTNVPTGLTNCIAVAAGTAHSLARRNDGTALAWGDNTFGQTNALITNTLVKLVAAGANHSMVAAVSPFVQYPINVTQDLLLVYNATTADGSNVFAYCRAQGPYGAWSVGA
jgi:alpha-tubulin suppressor-like RCC1 family protein